MKSTFTRNLQIGFGLSFLLLVISSVASFVSIRKLIKTTEMVSHTSKVIQNVEAIISTLKDAETGQRGFLLTKDTAFLQPYNGAYNRALTTLYETKRLTADNPKQQYNCAQLEDIIKKRLGYLQALIDKKKLYDIVSTPDLQAGKKYMDSARQMVEIMKDEEQKLLDQRNADLSTFTFFTPILIVAAAILSLLITVFFYRRVLTDFQERSRLQKDLQDKDIEISRRIDIIQDIAGRISAGDYKTRVNDEQKDGLGNLSFSLNRMAESLDEAFTMLSAKEWMQTGIAKLNETMVGEKDVDTLSSAIVDFVAQYTHSQVGALYIKDDTILKLSGGYAFSSRGERDRIRVGEGIVGQAASNAEPIILRNIPENAYSISFASGDTRPTNVIAHPIFHEGGVTGVIELGTLSEYSDLHLEFLQSVSSAIGIALNGAQNRRRLQELFEETQAQSEELQSQHNELENINTELEAQTQKLQASEEELRVQQEELQQANQELEERTRLLEEKNQVIVVRNLEIQKKAEEIEQSSKYKSEFLANMSHELRTPLNSILLLSRLLSENTDRNLNNDQVESARVIQSSGKGLLMLIDEILDLSKIESGKMDLDYIDTDVAEIIGNMKSLFAPIAAEKNLQLNVHIDDAVPATINTDQLRLEQIIKNLVSNALKFTSHGSVSILVEPEGADRQSVSFTVKDTGLGIPEEKHKLIFEAFQQVDGSTKRKYGGTGLGLSISRELARLLGGDIYLESTPGRGSEFKVVVPVAKPEPGQVKEEPAAQALTITREFAAEKPAEKRFISPTIPADIPDDRATLTENDKIILIVEDDTVFAKELLKFTNNRGYKGVISVRGDLAAEMALQYQPIAILLDIQLPVKDGWQVMEELKSNPKLKHIPVHIMSSMEVKKESLTKGAVDFINKPFAAEQMQDVFQKLEFALSEGPKKVLIVEENPKHAKALAYFLESFNISAEIKGTIDAGVNALKREEVNCVILDMGIPDEHAYQTLDIVKKNPGLENVPIIIFTGKNLSKAEENRIKQYADSIVVKTAHSYQRILDEVGLFLHLIEENTSPAKSRSHLEKLGDLTEVLKGKTVLIADDDVRNIYSLTRSLEQHKMNIISAVDGKEALKQLEENPQVDIILMDMMMPEMDGYESIKRIRQDPKYRRKPILAVTAKAMVGDREKCIQAGASDYISKPVDIDQLISLLRVWLYDQSI